MTTIKTPYEQAIDSYIQYKVKSGEPFVLGGGIAAQEISEKLAKQQDYSKPISKTSISPQKPRKKSLFNKIKKIGLVACMTATIAVAALATVSSPEYINNSFNITHLGNNIPVMGADIKQINTGALLYKNSTYDELLLTDVDCDGDLDVAIWDAKGKKAGTNIKEYIGDDFILENIGNSTKAILKKTPQKELKEESEHILQQDFNNDNLTDIAYIKGSEEHIFIKKQEQEGVFHDIRKAIEKTGIISPDDYTLNHTNQIDKQAFCNNLIVNNQDDLPLPKETKREIITKLSKIIQDRKNESIFLDIFMPYRQLKNGCGAASSAYLAQTYGSPVQTLNFYDECTKRRTNQGIRIDQAENCLKSLNFTVNKVCMNNSVPRIVVPLEFKDKKTKHILMASSSSYVIKEDIIDIMKPLLKNNTPLYIGYFWGGPTGHAVLVSGFDDSKQEMIFADPMKGKYETMPMEQFRREFELGKEPCFLYLNTDMKIKNISRKDMENREEADSTSMPIELYKKRITEKIIQ